MQLQIGKKLYNFDPAKSAEFAQDVVAVVNEEQQTKLGKIGEVNAKYLITPEWKQLFER